MGGGTTVSTSSQQIPSAADAVKAWVKNLPKIYETQMKYAPLQAQQAVDLAQQYATPYGEAYLAAQKAMYPEEYAMRDKLSSMALERMDAGMPDWMRDQYRDMYSSNLGSNAGSPIGADYLSTNMLNANNEYQNYYQNLALSLSGSQPIFQAQTPQTSDYMSGFTPNAMMSYMANNVTTTGSQSKSGMPDWLGQMLGQGIGGLMGGIGYGMML